MSILKRFLTDDLPTILRRDRGGDPLPRVSSAAPTTSPAPSAQVALPLPKSPGTKVVILNWKDGENDPFSVVNETMRQHFRAAGKNVENVELSDTGWTTRIRELSKSSIEFALTWQGLGSGARSDGRSLWEQLQVPLMCIHGDHPSQMPLNHQQDGPYCHHLYTNADFARYSNRLFQRMNAASVIDIPALYREKRLADHSGDYFVFAKNVDDPDETEREWRIHLAKPLFDLYMSAAETLRSQIERQAFVEMHDELDALLAKNDVPVLDPAVDWDGYHLFHSSLDHYMRSYKSLRLLNELREFPVHVYGRGWDRLANRSPRHAFAAGKNMAQSQELYYSCFGIIDVSPSKGLHDRTRRAMANWTGFLSSANLEGTFDDISGLSSLFFDFRSGQIQDRCAAVMRDPEKHRHVARQFAEKYHDRFSARDFVNRLDLLAKLAAAGGRR